MDTSNSSDDGNTNDHDGSGNTSNDADCEEASKRNDSLLDKDAAAKRQSNRLARIQRRFRLHEEDEKDENHDQNDNDDTEGDSQRNSNSKQHQQDEQEQEEAPPRRWRTKRQQRDRDALDSEEEQDNNDEDKADQDATPVVGAFHSSLTGDYVRREKGVLTRSARPSTPSEEDSINPTATNPTNSCNNSTGRKPRKGRYRLHGKRNQAPGAVAVAGSVTHTTPEHDNNQQFEEDQDDLVWENPISGQVEEDLFASGQAEIATVADAQEDASFDKGRQFEIEYLQSLVSSSEQHLQFHLDVAGGRIRPTGEDPVPIDEYRPSEGNTVLHLFALRGDTSRLGLVAPFFQDEDENTNVDVKNDAGFTPLYIAAALGHFDMVQFLVQQCSADSNIRRDLVNPRHLFKYLSFHKTSQGTPLHVAAEIGFLKICRCLLEHGADPTQVDRMGATPLYLACKNGHVEIARLFLVDYEADPNQQTKEEKLAPLHIAIRTGKFRLVRLLLDHGAKVDLRNKDGDSPLLFAIQYAQAEVVSLILDKNASIDTFEVSDQFDVVGIVNLLIEAGADVNLQGGSLRTGSTALMKASSRGLANVVDLLVQRGVDLDQRDASGQTALAMAVRNNNLTSIQLLLDAGANINQTVVSRYMSDTKDEDGRLQQRRKEDANLLHIAATSKNLGVLQLLLKYGSHLVNAPMDDGTTPLHIACIREHWRTAKDLLEAGADPTMRITGPKSIMHRATPLHVAVTFGNVKIVELLCDYGANINDDAEGGPTPLDLATREGHTEISEFLVSRGATLSGLQPSELDNLSFTSWNPMR